MVLVTAETIRAVNKTLMPSLRFILTCCTIAIGIFAMAEAAWADRQNHETHYDQSAEAHRLMVMVLDAKTPEAAEAASNLLAREFNISMHNSELGAR